jgi:hypothetical protein
MPAFAVIVADPTVTPVTTPALDIVAIEVSLLEYATDGGLEVAGVNVTVVAVVPLTGIVDDVADNTILPWTTLTVAFAVAPLGATADMVDEPGATPVTTPAEDIVAIPGFELAQVMALSFADEGLIVSKGVTVPLTPTE